MNAPERLRSEDLAACGALIEAHPHKPYAHYAGKVDESALGELLTRRLARRLEDPAGRGWWIAGEGLAVWSELPWDTERLGMRCARLEHLVAAGAGARDALVASVLDDCARRGARHVVARVPAGDPLTVQALEGRGFVTLDCLLSFAREVPGEGAGSREGVAVRPVREADVPAIGEIARASFRHGRFFTDPAIPPDRAADLHASWAENAARGIAADAVLVAEAGDEPAGFVACVLDAGAAEVLGLSVGTITLVATAERARGRGVGRALTGAALAWFRRNGAAVAEVGTQATNVPAAHLYESCGFRLAASHVTLRALIGDG